MFTEVNEIKCVIIRPPNPPGVMTRDEGWHRLAQLFDCIFLVDPGEVDLWRKYGRCAIRQHVIPYVQGNLKSILSSEGLLPCETVYVTWDPSELNDAVNARVGTVLVGDDSLVWDGTRPRAWPDLLVSELDGVIKCLDLVRQGRLTGYAGEVGGTTWKRFKRGSGWLVAGPDCGKSCQMQILALGRYFPTGDARAAKHQYTQRLLEMKNGCERVLAEVLGRVLEKIKENMPFQLVTVVPPKPSKHYPSGLQETVERACNEAGLGGLFCDTALICKEDYPSQKCTSWSAREENVKGKYEARLKGSERHVVVIDDIYTSGSTIRECCKQLLQAGAGEVTGIVFGVDQCVIKSTEEKRLPCRRPGCNGTYRFRCNRADHTAFWGCSKFQNGCKSTLDWEDGLQELNRMNTVLGSAYFDDIPF